MFSSKFSYFVVFIAILFVFELNFTFGLEDPVVVTKNGAVRGSVFTTKAGNTGYRFLGLPYGGAATGNLRFAAPEAKKSWAPNVLNLTRFTPACFQLPLTKTPGLLLDISEDCLTMDIYAPVQNLTDASGIIQHPVMFYIFGGAFDIGSTQDFNKTEPLIDRFVARGVVLIFVDYRVNIFSQFTTGTQDAAGNNGLKDIILALKWVQSEILAFGGNKSRVTIFGESSGGMNVNMLSYSPLAEGLFQQAIPMSGPVVSESSTTNGPEVDVFKRVTSALGCNNNNQWESGAFDEVLTCMRQIEDSVLLETYLTLPGKGTASEPRIDGPGGVLPQPVLKLLAKRRPMPYMLGTTSKEVVLFLPTNVTAVNSTAAFGMCTGMALQYKHPNIVARACRDFYKLNNATLAQHSDTDHIFWYDMMIQIINDNFFVAAYKDASFMRSASNNPHVYLYSFDYVKKGLEHFAPWHAIDLWYLFDFDVHPGDFGPLAPKNADDRRMDFILPELWVNFAKYGNPTPKNMDLFPGKVPDSEKFTTADFPSWRQLDHPLGYNHYSIDVPGPKMKEYYHYDAVHFWNDVVPSLDKFIGA